MTTHHKQVLLSDAVPGMMLWDAVTDDRGHVLLPAATVLTAAMLASLARHQIEMLPIAGAALSDAEELARSTQQSARLAWLFRQPGTSGAPGTDSSVAAQADGTTGADTASHAEPAADATAILQRYVMNFRAGSAT